MKRTKIVIVGGVAGGASAATRARRVNEHAEIILFEKESTLSFANCGCLPIHRRRNRTTRETPCRNARVSSPTFNLDVRTCQEIIKIDRSKKVVTVLNHSTKDTYDESYDKLILAPGASPIVPPIAGVQARNVLTLRNLEDTPIASSRLSSKLNQPKPWWSVRAI